MRGPGAMMDIGPGPTRLAVLDEGATEYEDDLVRLVMVDPAHPVTWLPFDQHRALAGLWILEKDLPSRTRSEIKRSCVLGIDVRDRFCCLHRHKDLRRIGRGDSRTSSAIAANGTWPNRP